MTASQLDQAIQRSFDGELTEAECAELRAVLKSDPSARSLYFEYAGLQQALVYRLCRFNSIETAKSLARDRLRVQRRRSTRIAMIAAAVVMMGIGITLRLILVSPTPAVAILASAYGSQFAVEHADPTAEAKEGELKVGTTVHLAQGVVEVKLRNGTMGIVVAPAIFNLQSENRLLLQQGTAWFRVSKEGYGFQVVTPEMTVTDLGTEFGVLSHPNTGDEIHVFSGRVIAQSLNALHTKETITSGQACLCDPVGRFQTIRIRGEDFLLKLPEHSDANLIANGNFEAGNFPANNRYGLPSSAALLPFWSFGNNIAVALNDNSGHLGYGENGSTIVSSTADVQVGFRDVTAGQPAADEVTIRQNFTTIPGVKYVVGFEIGACFYNANTVEITASVCDGAGPGGWVVLGRIVEQRSHSAGNGYKAPVRFTFTARSHLTSLAFTETSDDTYASDPVIDNISVIVANE